MKQRVVASMLIFTGTLIYLWCSVPHIAFAAYVFGMVSGMLTLRQLQAAFAAKKAA